MGSIVVLTLVFCLTGTPCLSGHSNQQQTIHVPAEDGIDLSLPIMCAKRGQELAFFWLEDHPKWELALIRCAPSSAANEDI